MALTGAEAWSRGFVFDGDELAATDSLVDARDWNGFLRDPDGRLVTSAGPGEYDRGFVRDDNGALVVAGGASTPALFPIAETTLDLTQHTLLEDAATTWFVDPRAVTLSNGIVVSGGVTTTGSIDVAGVSPAGVLRRYRLHAQLQADDHDNPSFVELADGRVRAFYARHSTTDVVVHTRTTTNPVTTVADLGSWGADVTITMAGAGTRLAYVKPFRLTGEANRLYLVYRSPGSPHKIRWSDDAGSTWGTEHELVGADLGGVRPYFQCASNGGDRIDFICTNDHPRDADNSLWHFYYKGGNLHESDGTVIQAVTAGVMTLGSDPGPTKIYDYVAGGNIDCWAWDLVLDSNDNPHALYAVFPTATDHRYRAARWTGSAWRDAEVTDAGGDVHAGILNPDGEPNYSGGASFDPQNPNRIYASVEAAAPVWEIERHSTADGGLSWSFDLAVTSGSTVKNIRPYKPRGAGGLVTWLKGRAGVADGGYSTYETFGLSQVEIGRTIDTAQTTPFLDLPFTGAAGAAPPGITKHTLATGILVLSDANRMRNNDVNVAMYYADALAPTADYRVECDMTLFSLLAGSAVGPAMRADNAALTFYSIRYVQANLGWTLIRSVAGTLTTIGAASAHTLVVGRTYVPWIEAAGDQIRAGVDGVQLWNTTTDMNIAAAGRPGVRGGGATAANTTGWHIDNLRGRPLS